ncbi:hypothetical protein B0H13DRAFT_2372563 [Mycena leptocephala]|nr:hypothetical protein B0H13DRAFT_2372563 [Mycena leptocephala]
MRRKGSPPSRYIPTVAGLFSHPLLFYARLAADSLPIACITARHLRVPLSPSVGTPPQSFYSPRPRIEPHGLEFAVLNPFHANFSRSFPQPHVRPGLGLPAPSVVRILWLTIPVVLRSVHSPRSAILAIPPARSSLTVGSVLIASALPSHIHAPPLPSQVPIQDKYAGQRAVLSARSL